MNERGDFSDLSERRELRERSDFSELSDRNGHILFWSMDKPRNVRRIYLAASGLSSVKKGMRELSE